MKAIKVFGTIRNLLAFAAGVMLILALTAKDIDIFYTLCAAFTLSAVASDVVVIVLHRKNGIELKKHENYFRFKKRK